MYGNFIDEQPPEAAPQMAAAPITYQTGAPSIKTWMVVLIGVLIALWALPLAWRGVDDQFHEHVGLWNLMTETIEVGFGIVLLKIVFNHWQINGLTQIVNTM